MLSLVEISNPINHVFILCSSCDGQSAVNPNERFRYMSWRFEPLKFDFISNKEIIKTITEEKIDVPLLIPEYN